MGLLWAVALQMRSTILSLPLQRKNEGQRTVMHMKSVHTHIDTNRKLVQTREEESYFSD